MNPAMLGMAGPGVNGMNGMNAAMAANAPQQRSIQDFILEQIRQQPVPQGWQATMKLDERVVKVWELSVEFSFVASVSNLLSPSPVTLSVQAPCWLPTTVLRDSYL